MSNQRNRTEQSPITEESAPEQDEPPELDVSEPGDEFPGWFRRVILLSVMLSAIFLVVAYVYPRVRSDAGTASSKPLWKQKANDIIEMGLSRDPEKVPELLPYLDSRSQPIRQNTEWALHFITGMPWATKTQACRKWWAKHGEAVIAGTNPSAPRPEANQFNRRVTTSEMNLEFFFNLISRDRVVFSGGTKVVEYELGVVNNNEEETLHIFPPDKLPFRAYRYGAQIPEQLHQKKGIPETVAKVPVHLQYGPSVVLVYLEWLNPAEPDQPHQREFLEFTVLGRNKKHIQPKKMLGIRKPFPIHANEQLFSEGPHVIARLTLDGRDLLAQLGGEEVRIAFDSISHELHIFRQNPDQVPGYSDQELDRIKSKAREEGYVLQRAERMYTSAFTRNTGIDTGKPIIPDDRETAQWTVGEDQPSSPRTFAGSTSAFKMGALVYDPKLGWGQLQEDCASCETEKKASQLHKIKGYLGTWPSVDRAENKIAQNSGRRWVLVFRKRSEMDQQNDDTSDSSK